MYKCSECGKEYKRWGNYWKHCKEKHGIIKLKGDTPDNCNVTVTNVKTLKQKEYYPGFYIGMMVAIIAIIAGIIFFAGFHAGRVYFPVKASNTEMIELEHYQGGGQVRSKNPILDSAGIASLYLWNRIQPKNLRDTIILTTVLNSDSIWTPDWLLAQAWTESRWQSDAVSAIGCLGLLQIHPGTARLIGRLPEKLSNPVYNIETAYIYLNYLTQYHGDRMKVINSYATGRANSSFGWFYHWYVMQKAEKLEWMYLL